MKFADRTTLALATVSLLSFGALAGQADGAVTLSYNKFTGNLSSSGSLNLLASTSASAGHPRLLMPDGDSWKFFTGGGSASAGGAMSPNILIGGSPAPFAPASFAVSDITATFSGGGLVSDYVRLFDDLFYVGAQYVGFQASANDSYPIMAAGGSMTLIGNARVADPSDLVGLGNGVFVSDYNGDTITLTVVPEPSATILVGLGVFALGVRRRGAGR